MARIVGAIVPNIVCFTNMKIPITLAAFEAVLAIGTILLWVVLLNRFSSVQSLFEILQEVNLYDSQYRLALGDANEVEAASLATSEFLGVA